jgi:DNA-binding CsgD family transcriptional regulator
METEVSEQVTHRNNQLLDLLASGTSHVDAAAELNISTRTVQRALESDEFRTELQHRREQIETQAATRLPTLFAQAIDVLQQAMASGNMTDRLRAARLTFDWRRQIKRDSEITDQLNRIESAIQGQEDAQRFDTGIADRPDPVAIATAPPFSDPYIMDYIE